MAILREAMLCKHKYDFNRLVLYTTYPPLMGAVYGPTTTLRPRAALLKINVSFRGVWKSQNIWNSSLKHESRSVSLSETSELHPINPVPIKRNAMRSRPYNKCAASPLPPQKTGDISPVSRKYGAGNSHIARFLAAGQRNISCYCT